MADDGRRAGGKQPNTGKAGDAQDPAVPDSGMIETIGGKEARKLKAREEKNQSVWFGLGMFGVVGWSVAVPTVLGIVFGCWLDSKFGGPISWCLTFLFVGLVIGAANAWNWLKKEGRLE